MDKDSKLSADSGASTVKFSKGVSMTVDSGNSVVQPDHLSSDVKKEPISCDEQESETVTNTDSVNINIGRRRSSRHSLLSKRSVAATKLSKKRRAPKVTEKQQEIFMEFMEKYPDFCRGRITGLHKERLWYTLAQMLNKAGVGPAKGVEKWKKTWADWKSGVKTKALRIRSRLSLVGNKHHNHHLGHEYLSPLEERMVAVAGWLTETTNDATELNCDDPTKGEVDEEQLVIPCFPENVPTKMNEGSSREGESSSSPRHFFLAQPSDSRDRTSCSVLHRQVPVTSASHHFIGHEGDISGPEHILFAQVPIYEEAEDEVKEEERGASPPDEVPKLDEETPSPSSLLDIQLQQSTTLAGIKRHLGTIAQAQKRRAAAAERKASAMENLVTILSNFLNK